MTNGAWTAGATVTLTPGDWDVSGTAAYAPGGSFNFTGYSLCINNTAAAYNETLLTGAPTTLNAPGLGGVAASTGMTRWSVTTNTQIWTNVLAAFPAGTMGVTVSVYARRVR